MSKFSSYNEIKGITNLPIASRRLLAIGRNGAKIKPRNHHLHTNQVSELRKEYAETGNVPNPFNRGAYHYTLAALLALGMNRKHPIATVQAKFRELMSDKETRDADGRTAWQRFRDKAPRGTEETSLDWSDRFEQNIKVLQRFGGFNPYGLKLNQVGTQVCRFKGLVIDLLKNKEGEIFVRLNNESNRPVNELKVRNVQPAKVARKVVRRKRATATVATNDASEAQNSEPQNSETPALETAAV